MLMSVLCSVHSVLVASFIINGVPLTSAKQHPSYGDRLEVKREYYQNCCLLDCLTQCSQSAAHLYEQFLQVPTDWVYHIGTLTLYGEVVS